MRPEPLLDIKNRLIGSKDLSLDEKAVGPDCLAALKSLFRQQTALTLSDCDPPLTDDAATHLTVNGRCDALFPWAGNNSGRRNVSLTLLDCSTEAGITERHAVLSVSLPSRSDFYPLISQYSEEPNEDLEYLVAEIA